MRPVRNLPPLRPIEFLRPKRPGIAPLALTVAATLAAAIMLASAIWTTATQVPADADRPVIFVGKAPR